MPLRKQVRRLLLSGVTHPSAMDWIVLHHFVNCSAVASSAESKNCGSDNTSVSAVWLGSVKNTTHGRLATSTPRSRAIWYTSQGVKSSTLAAGLSASAIMRHLSPVRAFSADQWLVMYLWS